MPRQAVENLQQPSALADALGREGMDCLRAEGEIIRLNRSHALGLEGFVQPHELGTRDFFSGLHPRR